MTEPETLLSDEERVPSYEELLDVVTDLCELGINQCDEIEKLRNGQRLLMITNVLLFGVVVLEVVTRH